MRTQVIEKTVYNFDELTESQQDKAIEKLYDINIDYEWYDGIYEDAEQIGLKITSFDIDRASYCNGEFLELAEEVAELILRNHGAHCETYQTAKSFLDEVKPLIELRDNFADDDNTSEEEYKNFDNNTEKIEELEEDFLKLLCEDYRIMLSKEYDYQTSREAIIETIHANEYEFDENGNIA
jgi:hypothetical protein